MINHFLNKVFKLTAANPSCSSVKTGMTIKIWNSSLIKSIS